MIDFVVVSSDLRPYVLDTFGFEVVDARSLVPVKWRQPPNPVVDTGSKGCRQAEEEESYRTMLACGTPDAVQ
ncbi:hypothetical protein L3Q82_000454 [Scortum barcoo]|uniref:Uncharacterized protein n=1 Tax=Scortum barcoo TaxID=214431 RepID=A0ACB8WG27_9TELE|nr:hypothetical protein L3Q82_000454 [Scortum barcoo]